MNPFESVVLPHLRGRVIDIGCGLGNLALAAAHRGCEVFALDASRAGIDSLAARARGDDVPVQATVADAREFEPGATFDAVVSIGLLMFFDCRTAHALLGRWQGWVEPGGVMAVNVLVEGTTYLDMFEPAGHCLWAPADVDAAFAGWEVLAAADDEFSASRGTLKRFRTLIARKRDARPSPIMPA